MPTQEGGSARHPTFGVPRSARVAVLLASIFLAAHLAFLPASLEDLDSINFALGLRRFDVAQHQPHPPGYPLFIAAGRLAQSLMPSEASALALVSVVAGSAGVFALVVLFRRLDEEPRSEGWAIGATALTVASPLYWFTAARPLSDVPGLVAAVGIQALTVSATTVRGLAAAAFLAAFATGIRSQVAWLTVPLLVLAVARRPADQRGRLLMRVPLAFAVGGLAWGIPLVLLTGGPSAYWRAVFSQGAEDLSGVQMLWTTPTARQLLLAMDYAFVEPWAVPALAAVVVVLALAGAIGLLRAARTTLATIGVAFGPYFVFDVLFQETITTRYALPLVVPVVYLAVRGVTVVRGGRLVIPLVLAGWSLAIGVPAVTARARSEAPAFRMLADMRARQTAERSTPVLAMHRRADFDLRRPIVWVGDRMPQISRRLSAPPKHEWLELVKYWLDGGRDDVWFVADPQRTDLALVDPASRQQVTTYRWNVPFPALLGGVRPNVMDWYRIRRPGWFAGEGWALMPETAGVAQEDGQGPGRAPVTAWIRRRPEPVTLVVGGRNLGTGSAASRVTIAIDGRTIDEPSVLPGFFLRMLRLDAGAINGVGEWAALTVGADRESVAVEQFDAQSVDQATFGFGDGWHEQEYNPATGRSWRWLSEQGTLRVHAAGRPLTLTLRGESPRTYFSRPSRLIVRVSDHVALDERLSSDFSLQVTIPAAFVSGDERSITLETDQVFLPAERSRRSRDRRHLGLRFFTCEVRSAS